MSADRLREPMSLLRHLWTATGYDSEIRVCDLFSDDDPIRFDIEAVLGEDEARSPAREGLRQRIETIFAMRITGLSQPCKRDAMVALQGALDDLALSSPPDLALSEGRLAAEVAALDVLRRLRLHKDVTTDALDDAIDQLSTQIGIVRLAALSSPTQKQGAET